MDPAAYDRWYETPRGRRIGERETALVVDCLAPCGGESLLDVGCGTGYFTRALGQAVGGRTVGVDVDAGAIAFAKRRDPQIGDYVVADARRLPFADASFDLVVSIAALCFVEDAVTAVREIVRVTRRRFAVGLLNRRSLLWLQKGRSGGSGGYRGATWHTPREAVALFDGLSVGALDVRTAVHWPWGGAVAGWVERAWPAECPTGAFVVVSGAGSRQDRETTRTTVSR
jgi:SAM-dependent methyltransferase